MKNFIKLLLVTVLFAISTASLAKDGPFPLYASVGLWTTANKAYKVEINIGKLIDNETALVRVIIRDGEDKFYASGLSEHKLGDSKLSMVLTTVKDVKIQINLEGEYRLDAKTNKKYLELKFDMFQLDSQAQPSVPTTLNKLH
ncbi:MAG: hypothetical protein IPM57_03185 [Oligoflexia bacterium]|nr:hypothetical protein [Oligoflexia bacterium]